MDEPNQLWHAWPDEPAEDFALFNLWLECGSPPLGSWHKSHPDLERVAALSVSSLYAKSGRWDWRPRSHAWTAWRRRVDQEAAHVTAREWGARTSTLLALYQDLLMSSLQSHLESGKVLPLSMMTSGMKEFVQAARLLAGESTENHAHALTQATEDASMEDLASLHGLLTKMNR